MRIRIRSDPLIFCSPDPVLFSADPHPTYNNWFLKLFSFWTKYKPESTNSSIKWWFIISNFMPTYLRYKYIFFFISISGRIRNFFSAEPDSDPWKKIPDLHLGRKVECFCSEKWIASWADSGGYWMNPWNRNQSHDLECSNICFGI